MDKSNITTSDLTLYVTTYILIDVKKSYAQNKCENHLYEVIQRTFSQMIKEQIQLDIAG